MKHLTLHITTIKELQKHYNITFLEQKVLYQRNPPTDACSPAGNEEHCFYFR